jgi:hypothetical protein
MSGIPFVPRPAPFCFTLDLIDRLFLRYLFRFGGNYALFASSRHGSRLVEFAQSL